MKKYYVIGGQYCSYLAGEADTIREAKGIAEEHVTYGDNWAGWLVPSIYDACDVEPCENFFGAQYCPKFGALPRWEGKCDSDGNVKWSYLGGGLR